MSSEEKNALAYGRIVRLHTDETRNNLQIDYNILLGNVGIFLRENAFKCTIIALFSYVVIVKDVHFSIDDKVKSSGAMIAKANAQEVNFKTKIPKPTTNTSTATDFVPENLADVHYNEGSDDFTPALNVPTAATKKAKAAPVANTYANIDYLFVAQDVTTKKTKRDKCWQYVGRFVNVARAERDKFGIPVSITLAQGLLESNAGESRLTQKSNNHFGIKTFSKNVAHVVMHDDTPTDKFRVYNSAWESYRDHSLLLMKSHYKDLQYLSKNDYRGWARGLKKAGYATDPQYDAKLIGIIEDLQLYRLDY